jgi:hypothetical protein
MVRLNVSESKIPHYVPTLFGVVYASRLFGEVDATSQAYRPFRKMTEPELNMLEGDSNGHVDALLNWLNKWGCRISKKQFPEITDQLIKWFEKWKPRLPSNDTRLPDIAGADMDTLTGAYSELLRVDKFGPTSASKTLFATRPNLAMPWDALIQRGFELEGRAPGQYRAMLVLSHKEAEALITNARQFGVSAAQIPTVSGSREHTIPWLLDKYHWITITRRHRIPSCEELQLWAQWSCGEETS